MQSWTYHIWYSRSPPPIPTTSSQSGIWRWLRSMTYQYQHAPCFVSEFVTGHGWTRYIGVIKLGIPTTWSTISTSVEQTCRDEVCRKGLFLPHNLTACLPHQNDKLANLAAQFVDNLSGLICPKVLWALRSVLLSYYRGARAMRARKAGSTEKQVEAIQNADPTFAEWAVASWQSCRWYSQGFFGALLCAAVFWIWRPCDLQNNVSFCVTQLWLHIIQYYGSINIMALFWVTPSYFGIFIDHVFGTGTIKLMGSQEVFHSQLP